jgi:hypothetical protein
MRFGVFENRSFSIEQPSPTRILVADRPSRLRAAATNNPLAKRTDRNTARGRRIADLFLAYMEAMDYPTTAIVQANILAAAELKVAAEDTRKRLLDGQGDVDQLIRLENLAHRAERKLGIKQQARPAGPTLAEYLAGTTEEDSAA